VGEAVDLVALRNAHFRTSFFRCGADGGGGGAFTFDFFARARKYLDTDKGDTKEGYEMFYHAKKYSLFQ